MAFLGVLGKVAGFLFGSGGNGPSLASTIAEKVLPMSPKEEAAADAADLESAREYQPADLPKADLIAQAGLIPFILSWLIAALNAVVDAVNHAIRPLGFLWLAGGLSGLWKLPDPGLVDEFWQKSFWVVLTFFYGGRTIVKDLPALIKAIRK